MSIKKPTNPPPSTTAKCPKVPEMLLRELEEYVSRPYPSSRDLKERPENLLRQAHLIEFVRELRAANRPTTV